MRNVRSYLERAIGQATLANKGVETTERPRDMSEEFRHVKAKVRQCVWRYLVRRTYPEGVLTSDINMSKRRQILSELSERLSGQ